MLAVAESFITLVASVFAGLLGSLTGLGGGMVLVPFMVGILHIPMETAIPASLFGVLATSTGSAPAFVKSGVANVRAGILIGYTAMAGTLVGVSLGQIAGPKVLSSIFAGVLVVSIWGMFAGKGNKTLAPGQGDKLTRQLGVDGTYFDPAEGRQIAYGVSNVVLSGLLTTVVGALGGMLGVGGGGLQVAIMNRVMKMPLKAASATSNFMMGMTAAAGCTAFLALGKVDADLTGPTVLGVLVGSRLGSLFLPRIPTAPLRWLFLTLLTLMTVQMIWQTVTA